MGTGTRRIRHPGSPSVVIQFSSVPSLSRVRLLATPWTAARQASLSITNSRSLLKLMYIKSVMPSSHLLLCRPLLLLPSIFPSIRVFSNESALHIRWPKCLSFIFSISPSNEYSGLISFRIDWLNLLAIQGTLKSLLQHWRQRRKERYTHLNAEFQRIKRKGKKAFVSDQCKEIEENNRMGKSRDLFKKIKDTKGPFNQRWAQ